MERNPNPLLDPTFFKITAFSTSLGMGVMGAFLASMKDIRHDTTLEFTPMTVIAFVVCAAVGWFFWAYIRRRATEVK